MEISETKEGPELQDMEINREPDQQVQAFSGVAGDGLSAVPYVNWTAAFLLGFLRQSDSYEDELAWKMVASGFISSHPETVHRALAPLVKEGMVVAEPDGMGHSLFWRRYEITELGEAYLEYLANALMQHRKEMILFARIYEKQQRVSGSHSIKASGCKESNCL